MRLYKKKGKTIKYTFNYPKLYGNIFIPGTTIVRTYLRKNPLGGRTTVRRHRRRT